MCTTCGCNDCSCEDPLKLPVGPPGEKGDPSGAFLDYNISTTSTIYQMAADMIIGPAVADPFTAVKIAVYVSAGVGSLKIEAIDSGGTTLLYENTNITSTNAYNIETITEYLSAALSIYPSDAIIRISVKNNAPGNLITSTAATYYYL